MSNYRRGVVVKLIKFIENNDATASKTAKACGLDRSVCAQWLRAFHEAKLVSIVRYELNGTKVYGWGGFPDAIKPPKLTNTERCRVYRRKRAARKKGVPVTLITHRTAIRA